MELFDLKATHNPHRWHLLLTPEVCVGSEEEGRRFMFGGVGMGAAIAAMERTSGRSVIWATAQYLSYAPEGSTVDFDVWLPAEGHHITQARVNAHIGDKEILSVIGALGSRPGQFDRQWASPPAAPPPLTCPLVDHWNPDRSTIQARLEMRLVKGSFGNLKPAEPDGRMVFWIRAAPGERVDATQLAIYGDLVPSGIANALGMPVFGNSLDNAIRFIRQPSGDWVLCDLQIQSVLGGCAHGEMLMFDEAGALIATASQSMIARIRQFSS